ncbi:MAG: XdhC family protein [Solirubrobacterales bacterium]|nr:XdhC family protein [Solirubrobacterales bacterium]
MKPLLVRLGELAETGQRGVLLTVIDGEGAGSKLLWLENGGGDAVSDELHEAAREVVRSGRNRLLELGGRRVFAEVYGPPPRLFMYGAVDTAEALSRAARLVGWRAIVADARPMFATKARIPSADELIVAWPDEAFAQVLPDHQTAVLVLTHEDKFDRPALAAALATEAFYIGALGSRRNQERRRGRLLEEGIDEEALERISGPCGLDIGAETQEETAISIFAEILAARAHRGGGPLRAAEHRIHAQVD